MFGGIGGDSNYKREQNHKFLAITTTMLTGSMALCGSDVHVYSPDGALAK